VYHVRLSLTLRRGFYILLPTHQTPDRFTKQSLSTLITVCSSFGDEDELTTTAEAAQ